MNKKIKNILRKLHGAAMSISPEATVKEINAFIKKDIDQALTAIESEIRRCIKKSHDGFDLFDFWRVWRK